MSAAPVFVSRLVGLPLLDSAGTTMGRVDDVVVGYPGLESPPPVLGFVADIQRRHIFVNANRVSDLGKPPNHLVAAGASRVRSTAAPFSLVGVMERPSDAPDQLIGMPFNS